jgi:hypothetical protein
MHSLFRGQRERITIRDAVKHFCESKEGTPNYDSLRVYEKRLNRLMNAPLAKAGGFGLRLKAGLVGHPAD